MTETRREYGVWLRRHHVGTLNQRGDYTWFTPDPEYLADPERPVLGLVFEETPEARHSSALRLPPWFSNLLPEGRLRQWIAGQRHVSGDREMELLAEVGHDLPGAVRVLPEDSAPQRAAGDLGFSLAGVALKFSMLRDGERLTLPAHGQGGDWIVKLPDPFHADVPRNEYAMMSLAAAVGIDVPEVLLVDRADLAELPSHAWRSSEELAYAVRRFDRDEQRQPVHIEDFAQLRNTYPNQKYEGSSETVAFFAYRYRDLAALREFARRTAFNVLISNGDAHLKNWSLIYRDPRIPTLAPAYDLVSTAHYQDAGDFENLALKFGKTRSFDRISLDTFERLQRRPRVPRAGLPEVVAETVERARREWPRFAPLLDSNPALRDSIAASIEQRSTTLLERTTA
ncbi:type II toxin-antitoxin system HipA family toxin [Actinopolyspora saharensis]|uniref:type II toxin-antitoxin system HipA family toxin n=1 Tax=Actinopolyspora saharensis TaxID=995062 RepID=UPI003F664945